MESSVIKRIEKWKEFRKCVENLRYLCRHLHTVDHKVQGLVELERELAQDFSKESINRLCVRDQNDKIEVIRFPSAGSLLKFAGEFSLVNGQKYSNDFFLNSWKNQLQEAYTDKPDLSLDDIYLLVWQPCLTQCKQLLESLTSLSMKLSEVDSILEPRKAHLETQLQLLFKGINETSKIYLNPSLLDIAVRRVRDYWNLRRYQKGADIFLRLRTSLGLTKGDFYQVERLSKQLSTSMNDQTLKDVDESLTETGKFLKDVARDHRKVDCLEMFAQCQDIVKWLQETTKESDVNEITSFVNVALATAAGGEGDLSHDKLSNLRTVGSGFASLIFIPKDAGFIELKKACASVWEALDKNPSLPSLLDDCNKDIAWYMSVKDTQGSVEVTSYWQMRKFLNYGHYLIGTSAQSTAVDTIHNLISLKLINTDKQLNKTSYNLEDLRDLESKLVLITGTNANNRMEVDHYLNILYHVTRIAEVLLALQQAGNIAYSGWMMSFNCATYTVSIQGEKQELQFQEDATACRVAELRTFTKNMENALREWENEVEESRSRHYELNYYTTLQLLRLRKELGFVQQNPARQVDPEILALLESISPEISSNSVTSVMASLEKHLLDLRAAADYVPYEEPSLQASVNVPVVTIQANSPTTLATVGTEVQVLPEICPTPAQSISLTSSRKPNNNPIITEDDLKEDQKTIFSDLVECYSRLLLLKAFEDCSATANQYDIQDWCDENDGFLHFDVEEGQDQHNMDVVSSEESSTNSGSDDKDKEKMNLFSRSTQKSPSEFKPSHLKNKYPNVELKVVHKPLTNESHPVVQQLVEEEYDLDASIEAVQLFGTLEKAIDYLATKDADSGDEESVTPTMASTELTTDESGNITVYDDPNAEEKYLSLDELGIVLGKLSEQLPATVIKQRTFMKELQPGSPNLILTSYDNALKIMLAVYTMNDKTLPLPTFEEVLICNSSTTAEEVIVLWRRAVDDPKYKRIFCLVNAEKLSSGICEDAFKVLKELINGKQDYRLVIMCNKDEIQKSPILMQLLPYTRSIFLQHSDQRYRDFLRYHFIDSEAQDQTRPHKASAVDQERSCVRVVSSKRAGMGKSLYIKRMAEQLATIKNTTVEAVKVVIPVRGPNVTSDEMLNYLTRHYNDEKCKIYHFDLALGIGSNLESMLFSLLVLHGLADSQGRVWRCHASQLYVIETTLTQNKDTEELKLQFLDVLPVVNCLSPVEAMEALTLSMSQVGMDEKELHSSTFQRAYQYLKMYYSGENLDYFNYRSKSEGSNSNCVECLLQKCGLKDPSWTEIHNFVVFLDFQLKCCENSVFCDVQFVGDVMSSRKRPVRSSMKEFIVKFMISLSRDIATPLRIGEGRTKINPIEGDGNQLEYRRDWENRCKWNERAKLHPYIFFNEDGSTLTFIAVRVNSNGDLLDPNNYRVILEQHIMTSYIYNGLRLNGVNLCEDFRLWPKSTMIQKIATVMGIEFPYDPDETYVLTVDNLINILAIQMRFRCGIPVVIMGETGCGKTRLIRYMCELARQGREGKNMLIMKIHGGIKEKDIIDFMNAAEQQAKANTPQNIDTIVFFDEANTTDAIGLIKEIMCDRRIHGRPVSADLKFIAACNPYRRHSDIMIKRLESAGLDFYVRATKTQQMSGKIPLRQLVYRVLELPPSMRPLVYDFGQLKKDTEDDYIRQIVHDHVKKSHPNQLTTIVPAITGVLVVSQAYMRKKEDAYGCSFVSIRDVERAMIVFEYFCEKIENFREADQNVEMEEEQHPTNITSALVLAVSVCYHARLQDREEYEQLVSSKFVAPLDLPGGAAQFRNEIAWCQNVLLDNMELGQNIAKNTALRENVFMMAICIELRIPLFLVGKPGSSKSLAKSIIQESMHGKTSLSDLLKTFKQVQMFSYQCSQLATPESVIEVFKSAKRFQSTQDTTQYVSVVVLDEVGLAEDSPNLPLKALHPLLEYGTDGISDVIIPRKVRVAFIGFSNWALDPAKMNRGVMVTRGDPSEDELEFSAEGICSYKVDDPVKARLKLYFKPLSEAYKEICKKQDRVFFGLRDFYSLIKMLYWMCEKSGCPPTWPQLEHAIKRNFGGLKSKDLDPVKIFMDNLPCNKQPPDLSGIPKELHSVVSPDCTRFGLIRASLSSKERTWHGENRYLLFLTENYTYAALDILNFKRYLSGVDSSQTLNTADVNQETMEPFVLFGSSFPKDKEYTQVYRNIKKIKFCIETGQTVILLNFDNICESLCDVLDQRYLYYGDKRYVNLGLHATCFVPVHKDFKLILIAEKDAVYQTIPTLIINRLEKHFVLTSSVLEEWQEEILKEFEAWIASFCAIRDKEISRRDAFIGYQKDTPAAVVFQASNFLRRMREEEKSVVENKLDMLHRAGIFVDRNEIDDQWMSAVLPFSQFLLLQTATPDAVIRLMLSSKEKVETYFKMHHHSIEDYLRDQLDLSKAKGGLLMQVTTHGQLLQREQLERALDIKVEVFTLQDFDTEFDFLNNIRLFFQKNVEFGNSHLLVIQCASGHINGDLIACARYRILEERAKTLEKNMIEDRVGATHVLFIINIPVKAQSLSFVSFQGGVWLCAHIDDFLPNSDIAIKPHEAYAHSVSELFIGQNPPGSSPTSEGINRHDHTAKYRRLHGYIDEVVLQLKYTSEEISLSKIAILRSLVSKEIPDSLFSDRFYAILVMHIYKLLKEREVNYPVTSEWVLSVAMDAKRLEAGRTFTSSLTSAYDKIVIPIFAKIIAWVDCYNNLDLIDPSTNTGVSVRSKFWMVMFHKFLNILQTMYPDTLEDISGTRDMKSDLVFTCQMPFFWIIKKTIDSQWLRVSQASDEMSIECHRKRLQEFVCDGPVGEALKSFQSEEALFNYYLHDFVRSTYQHEEGRTEYQLVTTALVSILHAPYFFSVGKDEPLLYKIAGLHLASTLSQYPLSLHQYITPRPSLMEKSTQTPLTTTRNQATQMDKSVKVAKTQTVEKTLHTQATQTDKSSCDEENIFEIDRLESAKDKKSARLNRAVDTEDSSHTLATQTVDSTYDGFQSEPEKDPRGTINSDECKSLVQSEDKRFNQNPQPAEEDIPLNFVKTLKDWKIHTIGVAVIVGILSILLALFLVLPNKLYMRDNTEYQHPHLYLLQNLDGLKILQEIGASYSYFGTMILKERSGNRLSAIEMECKYRVECINYEVAKAWLSGDSEFRENTWTALIDVLCKIQMKSLAERIIETLKKRNIDLGDSDTGC